MASSSRSPAPRRSSRRGPAATSGRSSASRARSSRPSTRATSRPTKRPADRPTRVRRTAAQPTRVTPATASRARSRPGGITGRTIVLSVLVIGVVLLLILPVSNYLHQKSQIDQLQQQIADRKQQIGTLTDKNQLLDDPTYIKAQARERLNYVLPGDKVYVVSNNGPGSPTDAQKKKSAKEKKKDAGSALTDLAKSIEEADKGK